MGVSLFEQETVINFMRDSDTAEVYTSDSLVMRRLDKLAENINSPDWNLKETHFDQNGNIVAKTYSTKKKLISFKRAFRTVNVSEERKAELRERMLKYRREKTIASEDSDNKQNS